MSEHTKKQFAVATVALAQRDRARREARRAQAETLLALIDIDGISQREIAERASVTRQRVSAIAVELRRDPASRPIPRSIWDAVSTMVAEMPK